MRLLVISDVHADAAALERVLADAAGRGWDEALFLGDAVGYGEEVREALSILRSLPMRASVLGNHEAMLNNLREGRRPNAAREVVDRLVQHLEQLSDEDLAFLDSMRPCHLDEAWGAVHGALRKPFEYLISVPLARSNARHMERETYFVGHTHVPAAYLQRPGGQWGLQAFGRKGGTVPVAGARAFLNPGSVSLPRDRVPGYSYALYDEDSAVFTVHRVLG